ncbi:MAG: hypothetical protein OXC61_04920, partial [Flavobacteriaceae bacterium]|nr:hypothetical protein [Flavobacteriaceae bacterium]
MTKFCYDSLMKNVNTAGEGYGFFPSLRSLVLFLSMGLVLDTCTSDAISVATDAVFHIALDEDHLY